MSGSVQHPSGGARRTARPADHASVTSAGFRFRLEPVRALRERGEERAQGALAAALHREESVRRALAEADEQSRQARRQATPRTDGVRTSGAELRAAAVWIDRTGQQQQELALSLDRHVHDSTTHRGLLTEAARERQVLERLRERQQAAHRAEQGRIEQAELDEVALVLHRRKSA